MCREPSFVPRGGRGFVVAGIDDVLHDAPARKTSPDDEAARASTGDFSSEASQAASLQEAERRVQLAVRKVAATLDRLERSRETVFGSPLAARVSFHRIGLLGNSLGGGIAIQMALARPDFIDRLILMSPGCVEEREVYFAMPGIAKMVSAFGSPDFSIEDQRRLLTNLVYDPIHVTDALVSERYEVARTQPKDVLARMRTPNLAPRLGELKMPILGFWGLQDEFLPESGARRFLEACADVRFMTFNKVGHWVQVERAQEFNAYSIAFLNE